MIGPQGQVGWSGFVEPVMKWSCQGRSMQTNKLDYTLYYIMARAGTNTPRHFFFFFLNGRTFLHWSLWAKGFSCVAPILVVFFFFRTSTSIFMFIEVKAKQRLYLWQTLTIKNTLHRLPLLYSSHKCVMCKVPLLKTRDQFPLSVPVY